jgi:predicted metalloprotease
MRLDITCRTCLNISSQVEAQRNRSGQTQANRASVQLELQADCLAGLWANRTERTQKGQAQSFLDPGDVVEALQGGEHDRRRQIADANSRLRRSGSFTHGSAAQRMHVVQTGFSDRQILKPATPSN